MYTIFVQDKTHWRERERKKKKKREHTKVERERGRGLLKRAIYTFKYVKNVNNAERRWYRYISRSSRCSRKEAKMRCTLEERTTKESRCWGRVSLGLFLLERKWWLQLKRLLLSSAFVQFSEDCIPYRSHITTVASLLWETRFYQYPSDRAGMSQREQKQSWYTIAIKARIEIRIYW